MNIFGISITRAKPPETEKSFVAPSDEGGVESIRAGGYYGTYLDLEGVANNEAELIKRYRDISMMADVDTAIQDIIDDAIANQSDEDPVVLVTDKLRVSDTVKYQIQEEFENLTEMLDFKNRSHDYFRRWYVDGRLYFHKVVDTANPRKGIRDIRYIDPRKITKVKEVKKEKNDQGVQFVNCLLYTSDAADE